MKRGRKRERRKKRRRYVLKRILHLKVKLITGTIWGKKTRNQNGIHNDHKPELAEL